MIASYLIDPGRREHGLDALALQHLDHTTTTYEEVAGKGKSQIPFAEVPLEAARDYACEDADIALQLAERFLPELDRLKLTTLFRDIEIPLIEVLADMEWAGIRIDEAFFETCDARSRRAAEVERRSTRRPARSSTSARTRSCGRSCSSGCSCRC
jgi:DNA polymerase I